jgi:hypothetical protein
MESSDKRPVGRPRKDDAPKRPVGRPPNHRPVNQYTGVRAKNIEWVRIWLRSYLTREQDRGSGDMGAEYHRNIISACRLLLACEEVYINQQAKRNVNKYRERLLRMGQSVSEGGKLPFDLLAALNELEQDVRDDDV